MLIKSPKCNMIIPSGSSCSWLVGCHVGHTYAWLRNSCAAAASARWPALLPAGWEVRTRAPGGGSSWQQDAVTVDPLRGRVQTWQQWVMVSNTILLSQFTSLLRHWSVVNKFILFDFYDLCQPDCQLALVKVLMTRGRISHGDNLSKHHQTSLD